MRKIKVLLVGINGFGEYYLKRFLSQTEGKAVLEGVVDLFPRNSGFYDELMERNIPIYTDMQAFYAAHTADLAIIVTPIQFHTENILYALKNKSHVLCEKPLCADETDIERISKAQSTFQKHVFIGYQWTFSPAIQALKKDILSGRYGTVQSIKSMVLWPRDQAYFKRGTGWAGNIKDKAGRLVLDSVANNACAHYLHNMLYLCGESREKAASAVIRQAYLMRANDIENFDTAVIDMKIGGAIQALYIASHTTQTAVNPVFEIRFSEGYVSYKADKTSDAFTESCAFTGEITGTDKFGATVRYGSPNENDLFKLDFCLEVCAGQQDPLHGCLAETAGMQTRLINDLYKNHTIRTVKKELRANDGGRIYVPGLEQSLLAYYTNGKNDLDTYMGKG